MGPLDYQHANLPYLPGWYKWGHLFRRVYLGTYYPPFRERILECKAKAAERGAEYVSAFGYRPMAMQAELRRLYIAKLTGKLTDAERKAGKGGLAAPAGLSAHQYGLADDSTADADTKTPGLQPTWDPLAYSVLGEEAAAVGLIWGASFGDRPHVQWPDFVNGFQLQKLLDIWNGCPSGLTDDTRLPAVWQYLDALPTPSLPVFKPLPTPLPPMP